MRGISLSALLRCAALPEQSTTAQPDAGPAETPTGPAVHPAAAPPADVPPAVLEEYRADRYRFAARVGAQAARALAHAHRGGHLHRDVKPSNLMVDSAGQVYLVDFGLTRALLPGGDGSQPGSVRGTPWYMSPEQARGEVIDHRSDVYSLGVTLYELATGGAGPYTATRGDTDAVLSQVKAAAVLPLRVLARDVPPGLEAVIRRCLQRKPGRRYADAEELAADLEKVRAPAAGSATRSRRRWFAPRVRLRPAALGAAVVLALVALVALAPAFFRRPPAPPTAPAARRWNVAVPLLTRDHRPLQDRRLAGLGRLAPSAVGGLTLDSAHDGRPTLFALGEANEPCFEFAIELRRLRSALVDPPQEAGVFFGRRSGPEGPSPCFVVSVADSPQGGAVLQVKSWLIDEGDGVREPKFAARPLLGPDAIVTAVTLAPPDGWHSLRVQVRRERVAIFLDDNLTWEFDAAKLKRNPRAAPLSPRGDLGLYGCKAWAAYRNATLTALPPEEGGP